MRPSQLVTALDVLMQKQRAAFIWGPPGVGKSDVVKQLADSKGIELRDVRISTMEPTDLRGFPYPDPKKGIMHWLPASFLPQDPKSRGIIFLDELNQGSPSLQAAGYQFTLDRRAGDYVLPEGWAIIAAGNRQKDRANAQRMPSALANRLVHLNYDVHTDDWCTWANDNGMPFELVSFIRFKPQLLAPANAAQDGEHAFPTPRSWAFIGDLTHSGLTPDVELELFKGTVGEGAAGEYLAFLQIHRELPTVDQVKVDPEGTQVSENPAVNFAMAGALANSAVASVMPRFMKYVERMPTEFQVAFIRDAVRRTRGDKKNYVGNAKEFVNWSVKNGNYLV